MWIILKKNGKIGGWNSWLGMIIIFFEDSPNILIKLSERIIFERHHSDNWYMSQFIDFVRTFFFNELIYLYHKNFEYYSRIL